MLCSKSVSPFFKQTAGLRPCSAPHCGLKAGHARIRPCAASGPATSNASGASEQQPLLMRAAAALSALTLLFPSNQAFAQQVITGPARIVDGDTLVIGTDRVRLFGVDAPESSQTCKDHAGKDYACGQRSKEALAAKIGNQPVACSVNTTDMYGRNVSTCTLPASLFGQPEDINAWLVSNGYAVAYRQYSKTYVPLEEAAQSAHKGIWDGTFQMPVDYRKDQRTAQTQVLAPVAAAPAPAVAPIVCAATGGPPIKGNIGAKGDKIYHMPGSRLYDRVKIDLTAGERYFCTEAEAQAEGFRAAKT